MDPSRSEQELRDTLGAFKQHHILACLDIISPAQRTAFLQDIKDINFTQLANRYQAYSRSKSKAAEKKSLTRQRLLRRRSARLFPLSVKIICALAGLAFFWWQAGRAPAWDSRAPKAASPSPQSGTRASFSCLPKQSQRLSAAMESRFPGTS